MCNLIAIILTTASALYNTYGAWLPLDTPCEVLP